MKCPFCKKSQGVELITTEVGQVRWLNPQINPDGTIEDFGNEWKYEGGETWEGRGYLILCKKCDEVIKEIE